MNSNEPQVPADVSEMKSGEMEDYRPAILTSVSSAEVAGIVLSGFVGACHNLEIINPGAAANLLDSIEPTAWYPVADFLSLQSSIVRDYTNADVVLERAGEMFSRAFQSSGHAAAAGVTTGEGFLLFQTGSSGYRSVVRGDAAYLGAFELEDFEPGRERATVVSTTPFPMAFEKGLLLGGMSAPGDLAYVEVSAEQTEAKTGKRFAIRYVRGDDGFDEEVEEVMRDWRQGTGPDHGGIPERELFWRCVAARQSLVREVQFWKTANGSLERSTSNAKLLVRKFERLAFSDALTGLPNRRGFLRRAEDELRRARGTGRSLALFYLDIDHFKRINDSLGHAAGDKVIKEFADTCSEIMREGDVFARIGGEEFAMILPGITEAGALEAAERLRTSVNRTPLKLGERLLDMSVSIGVALLCDSDPDVDTLLARADTALYHAKSSGRNRTRLAGRG